MRKLYFSCLFLTILCIWCQSSCLALDWKMLHENAKNLTLDEAIALANKLPEDIDSLYMLGIAYLKNHEDKRAKERFLQMLEIDPNSLKAKWGIAEFERRIYRYPIADDALNKILQENPDFSPAYISLAYIKFMQCDFEEVVNLMGIVINQGLKNNDVTTYAAAHCLYAGGKGMIAYLGGPFLKVLNGPAVFRHLKIAEELEPESVAVDFGFGCYYLLRPLYGGQDLKKAAFYLKRAINTDPLFADSYVRLSQVYSLQGDEEQAKILLERALEIDPGNLLAADMISKECKFICNWK